SLLFAVLALAACSTNPYDTSKKDSPSAKPAEAPKPNGVHPDAFDCKKFLSEGDVAGAVGEPVMWQPADMKGTPGTPDPCIYVATTQPPPPADAGPRQPDAG